MDETGSSKVEVFKECISRSWGRVRPLPSLKDRWHGALQASAVCKLAMVRGGVGLFAEKERGGKGMQPVRSLVHPSHPPPLDRHAIARRVASVYNLTRMASRGERHLSRYQAHQST